MVIAALCVTHLAACDGRAAAPDSPGTGERLAGWRRDVDFLLAAISREHYVYRSKPLPLACQAHAARLKEGVGAMSDERILAELQRLLATLGDGHCYPSPSQDLAARWKLKQLPLRLHEFSDGIFVVDASPGHEGWIGRRVTRLGALPMDEARLRVGEYVPADNRHGVKMLGPILLGYRSVLEALGSSTGDEVIVEFAASDGSRASARIGFIPWRRLTQAERKLPPSRLPGAPSPPRYLKDTRTQFWFEPLPGRDGCYVQFNQVLDAPGESIEGFAARLDASLRKEAPGLLLVDVRHNNGGDASLLSPLIRVLQEFERRDRRARLVVITGPQTFSAAQIFIARVDHVTNAMFAGEPSSSRPNFVGEDNPVELPWSGLHVSISNRYHESIPGDTREWIEPDILVKLESRDYFSNRDPVLDAVLARFAGQD